MRIIMKNNPVMKARVIRPAICTDRLGCRNEGVNISSDQSSTGKVSRTDLPILRGAAEREGRLRASVAIYVSPHQHRRSQKEVINGNKHHRHARDGGYGFTAPHPAQTHKGHKPDGSSYEKDGKE